MGKSFSCVRPDGLILNGLSWPAGLPGRPHVLIGHSHVVHSRQMRAMAETFAAAGSAVLAPDMRGHGRSINAANPLMHLDGTAGWRRLVEDFIALCDDCFAGVPMASG